MGWKPSYTAKFMFRFRAVLPAPKFPRLHSRGRPKWPATVIEDLRRLHRLPYDEIDPQSDWLARYLKEGTHGSNRERGPDQR